MRTESTATPFHIGLTPAQVIDAAVQLTHESHLFAWSIRDLAGRLGVAPSVIYHHVGGKDLLCRGVVERVLERIELPPSDLTWQEWFRVLLHSAGPLAAQYPGVAKWMLMHGPTIPAVLPVLDAGMRTLRRAGFGDRAEIAYALLLNNAMLTIAMGDDRLQHEGDGPRDHATMMTEFQEMREASDELRAMGQALLRPFAAGGSVAAGMREAYYRFVIETTIAGLATTIDPVAGAWEEHGEGHSPRAGAGPHPGESA